MHGLGVHCHGTNSFADCISENFAEQFLSRLASCPPPSNSSLGRQLLNFDPAHNEESDSV